MNRRPCQDIATFPQFYIYPTCWFNATVMMVLFSQHSRNMILANKHKWANMSMSTKKLFETLIHEKTRSDDQEYFKSVNPETLLKALHEASPQEFYMHKMTGADDIHYLPRLYEFLGADNSIHFIGYEKGDYIDLFAHNEHKIANRVQMPEGTICSNRSLPIRSPGGTIRIPQIPNNIDEEYDYFTIALGKKYFLSLLKSNEKAQYKLQTLNPYHSFESVKAVMENIPRSAMIQNHSFLLGKTRYVLDSVFLAYPSGKDPSEVSHAVCGITCNDERYLYNGLTMKKDEKTRPLYYFDWIYDTRCLRLELRDRDAFKICPNSPFTTSSHPRKYVFVNEKYSRRPQSPITMSDPYMRVPVSQIAPDSFVDIDGKSINFFNF